MSTEKQSHVSIRKSAISIGIITSICFGGYYFYRQRQYIYKPTIKKIKNPLVSIVGITTYDGEKKPYIDLPGITNDIREHKKLWNGFFNYNLNILTDKSKQNGNDHKEFEAITKSKLSKYFLNIRRLLTRNDYDALICILTGHGHNDALITADRAEYKISAIKDLFSANSIPSFKHNPKIFIIDICRTSNTKNNGKEEKQMEKRMWESVGGDDNSHPDSNVCMIYSNTKNYRAQETDAGSPLVNCLVEVFKSSDLSRSDLNSIAIMICDAVAKNTKNKLCAEWVSTNTYLVYFEKYRTGMNKFMFDAINRIQTCLAKIMYFSTAIVSGYVLIRYCVHVQTSDQKTEK